MTDAKTRAAAAFAEAFGTAPRGVAFAPGRVNLIGDHVDYNDGLVLPMPLALGTAAAWRPRDDAQVVVQVADYDDARHAFALGAPPQTGSGWTALIQGMATVMAQAGHATTGINLLIAGDLPRGAGLSSSASLCIATGRALLAAAECSLAPSELALLAQQVEHRFAGVACGIMDQMVIAGGEPGAAMLLDCRSLAWETVPLPGDWSVIIAQSGVVRELVDGAYNTRRSECEAAARHFAVASLRDVDPAQADFTELPPATARRARHVIGEIARTRDAAQAIRGHRMADLAGLMRAAHASMRDLFEASHPEVDRQVAWLNQALGDDGGARMTGGGFGGAIVIVCRATRAADISAMIDAAALHGQTGGPALRVSN